MYDKLASHWGHKVEIAVYGDAECVTVECIDCGAVLIDACDYEEDKYSETGCGHIQGQEVGGCCD